MTVQGKLDSHFECSDGCRFVEMWVADLATKVGNSQEVLVLS